MSTEEYVKLLCVDGDDQRIARRARLSFDRDDDKGYERLVSYLIENGHTGPLEFCSMQFEVQTSLAIATQMIRHRCLTGDTQVDFSRPDNGRRYPITMERLYETWSRGSDENFGAIAHVERLKKMQLRSLDEETGQMYHTTIKDIWKTGRKEVFEVELADGRKAKMSADHRVYTNQGWVEVKDLVVGKHGFAVIKRIAHDAPEDVSPVVDTQVEIWKECAGYPEYEVSSQGRVRKGTRISKQTTANTGYKVLSLAKGEGRKTEQVHRLVMLTFGNLDGPSRQDFVLHRNGNKLDNRLSNLQWGNDQLNKEDAARLGELATKSLCFVEIEEIRSKGFQETYDMAVEGPHHNFLVNRGMVVHNCFSFNFVSMRYVEPPAGWHEPEAFRVRPDNVKQGSAEDTEGKVSQEYCDEVYRNRMAYSRGGYRALLGQGVCPEQARMLLPVGTLTRFVLKADLNNLFKYLGLRTDTHAQKEHRLIAEKMEAEVAHAFPVAYGAWQNFHKGAVRVSGRTLAALDEFAKWGDSFLPEHFEEGLNAREKNVFRLLAGV